MVNLRIIGESTNNASGHIDLQVELFSMQFKKNSVQLCNTVVGLCSCIFSRTGSHRAFQDGQSGLCALHQPHRRIDFILFKDSNRCQVVITKQWI